MTRPVTVTMCLVALLMIGAVSYHKIGLQAFPSGWEWKHLWIWVENRGSSPKENDQQICRLFEEYLGTVKNLRRIRTWAGSDWVNHVVISRFLGTSIPRVGEATNPADKSRNGRMPTC